MPVRFRQFTLERLTAPSLRNAFAAAVLCFAPLALVTITVVSAGIVDIRTVDVLYLWPLNGSPTLSIVLGLTDTVLLTPLVETALVLLTIRVLRWVKIPVRLVPFLSAVLWAIVHARTGNMIGLAQGWPFYFFTRLLVDNERPSLDRAWLYVSFVHGIHNTWALLLAYSLSR